MATRQSSRISAKRDHDYDPVTDQALHPTTLAKQKTKKSAAESTKDWKNNMKTDDPERYTAYKEQSRAYSKNYRQNMNDERRAISNQQAAARMRAMRKKKKEAGEKKPPLTRAAREEQRQKWASEKRMQQKKLRDTLSPQAFAQRLRQQNKRRREKYHAKKERNSNSLNSHVTFSTPQEQLPSCSGDSSQDSRTPVSRRKALSRAKAALPMSPRKFVHTVSDLIATASPKKQTLFKSPEKGRTQQHRIGETVLKRLRVLQKKRDKASHRTRTCLLSVCSKYSSIRASSTLYNISRKTALKYTSQEVTATEINTEISTEVYQKKRKLEAEVSVYMETVSHPLPDKKLVSKKTGKSASVMPKPLKDLHADFLQSTGHNISFSQFAKCRPAHIRTARQSRLRLCLCEYCTNVELKLRTVKSTAARISNNSRIRHIYHAIDIITCGRQAGGATSWKQACVLQQCDECSVDQLDLHLQPLQHQSLATWTKWESVPCVINGKRVSFPHEICIIMNENHFIQSDLFLSFVDSFSVLIIHKSLALNVINL